MSSTGFQPISSLIEPSFWHALSKRKLNEMMLDEAPFEITGFTQAGRTPAPKSFAFLNEDSFKKDLVFNPCHYFNAIAKFPLTVYLTNTKTSFNTLDRKTIMTDLEKKIIESIKSKEWLINPSLLLSSALTVYGDLKKWFFTYCFAFPSPTTECITVKSKTPCDIDFQTIQLDNWIYILKDGKLAPLSEATADSTFVCIDPSTSEEPGWTLRILSIAIAHTFATKTVKILSLNYRPTTFEFDVNLENIDTLKFTGWRLNGKKPYAVDLSATMDPMQLFTAASSLNLRLMKWRMSPTLNVDILKDQCALLIGCGTLGCNVARNLLAWGVRKFILVDNGKVSFSNPPRQSLFTFADCLDGGKWKAEAAAAELKRICPEVEAEVHRMSIPMPGHALAPSDYDRALDDCEHLEGLMKRADVTFLLTDTRESRWLPTLLGAANHRLVISIALGFDTYSIVRSGPRHLGCYFCNDVVAPTDTMTDRTLDMQCTVTRPGVSQKAAANGVELFVSLLNADDGIDAPADSDCCLGAVPHQLRGFLHSWTELALAGQPFRCCVACSDPVVDAWKSEGRSFMLRALTQQGYLADLSGITKMQEELVDEDCEWVDE